MDGAHVFVSYARADAERVLPFVRRLEEAGVPVWIDRGGIDGGEYWAESIVQAVDESAVLLVMASGASLQSDNVLREVDLAFTGRKRMLVALLEPTEIPPRIRYYLAGMQHIDFGAAPPDESFASVLRSLDRLGVSPAAPPPETIAEDPAPADEPVDEPAPRPEHTGKEDPDPADVPKPPPPLPASATVGTVVSALLSVAVVLPWSESDGKRWAATGTLPGALAIGFGLVPIAVTIIARRRRMRGPTVLKWLLSSYAVLGVLVVLAGLAADGRDRGAATAELGGYIGMLLLVLLFLASCGVTLHLTRPR